MKPTLYYSPTCRWVCVAALALLAVGAGAQNPASLTLAAESSHKLQVPDGVRRIYISNPNIISARPDDNGFAVLVTAQKAGKTELRISRMNLNDLVYKVEVEPELRELADEVSRMLIDVEGLNVKVVGDKIVLDGELLTRSSSHRAQEVADAFGGRVLNLTKLDMVTYTRNVKKALDKEIGIKTVLISFDDKDRLKLEGTVPSQRDLARVKEIAKRHDPKASISLFVMKP